MSRIEPKTPIAILARRHGLRYMEVKVVATHVLKWREGETKTKEQIMEEIEAGLVEVGLITEEEREMNNALVNKQVDR